MKNPAPRNFKCHICRKPINMGVQIGKHFICEPCQDVQRKGRDSSTRSLRAQNLFARDVADTHRQRLNDVTGEDAKLASDPSLLPGLAIRPIDAAFDAFAHRGELLTNLGTDAAALALDTSHAVAVNNPLEEMLVHQMAVAHKVALESITKSHMEENSEHALRLLNVAIRFMDSYQRSMLTLKRYRAKSEQTIVVQHVKITEGGQAVIGTVQHNGGAGQ